MTRLLAVCAVVLGLVVAGSLVRLPETGSERLEIDVQPSDQPPTGAAVTRQLIVRRLDPRTLADVPGQFLPVDRDTWAVPSDDGRLVALMTDGGGVTVVDRRTLTVRAQLDGVRSGGPVRFTPEGDALITSRGVTVVGPQQILTRYPLDGADPTEVELPPGVFVSDLRPLPGGRAAAFTLPLEDDDGARLLVADLGTGALIADVALPGREAPLDRRGSLDMLDPPGLGWDVERERLYVVSADRIRVVDLTTGAVVAQAAHGPADDAYLTAAVSPDGTRLYLTGRASGRFLGVRVLDTADLSEVAGLDLSVDMLALSPDGRWLALPGYPARVLDATTLAELGRLGEAWTGTTAFGPGSDVIYVETWTGNSGTVRAFSLPELEELGAREVGEDSFIQLDAGLLFENV